MTDRATHTFASLFREHADFLVLDHAVDDPGDGCPGHVRRASHEPAVVLPNKQDFVERDVVASLVRTMVDRNRRPWFNLDLPAATLNYRVHPDTFLVRVTNE